MPFGVIAQVIREDFTIRDRGVSETLSHVVTLLLPEFSGSVVCVIGHGSAFQMTLDLFWGVLPESLVAGK